MYRCYEYHNSKHITTPKRSCGNIKGLELEISDTDSGYLLDELIDENVLTIPQNENEKKEFNISVENDASVYKELVFKASCNRTLLKGVKKLEEKLHGNIYNGHGTSCHIHLNRRYLDSLNLSSFDIVKASEFLAPILYDISGRNQDSLHWTRSRIRDEISITDDDLYKRAKIIDDLEYDNLDIYERYRIVNLCPSNTVELRIFSNFYCFDYNYIKLYIETCDFIITLAEFMKNKSYVNEYDKIIEMTKNFYCKRNNKWALIKHDLDIYFIPLNQRELRNMKKQLEYFKQNLEGIKERFSNDEYENMKILLRVLRNCNNRYSLPKIKFNLRNFNIDNIIKTTLTNLENNIEQLENEIKEE